MGSDKYLLVNRNNNIVLNNWKSILFVPIPIVKTLGRLYHKYAKGNVTIILFLNKPSKNEIDLILLLTSSDVLKKSLLMTMQYFIEFSKSKNAKEINAIVVNKRLSEDILKRFNWFFIRKNWYIGSHYKLIL